MFWRVLVIIYGYFINKLVSQQFKKLQKKAKRLQFVTFFKRVWGIAPKNGYKKRLQNGYKALKAKITCNKIIVNLFTKKRPHTPKKKYAADKNLS